MKIFQIYPLLLAVLLFRCAENSEQTMISYDKIDKENLYGNCDSPDTGCFRISLKYIDIKKAPDINTQKAIEENMNEFLFAGYEDERYNNFEELCDSMVNDFIQLRRDFPDTRINYELTRNVEVRSDTLGIFSISKTDYSYFGGAHPNSYLEYVNFDAGTGKIIVLNDIFTSENYIKFTQYAEKQFREVRNIPFDLNLDEAGYYFDDGKFNLNDNFLISPAGLNFYYNSYEIAPYSEGITELKFTFKELTTFIEEGSYLGRFIN